MRRPPIPLLIHGVIFLLLSPSLYGQSQYQDTLNNSSSIKTAISLYSTGFNDQLRLYNGIDYESYDRAIQGDAYYPSHNWYSATLNYDGSYFENVPLLYDAVKDAVIIKYPNSTTKVRLVSNKVTYFTFNDHKFIRIDADSTNHVLSTGFYDELVEGNINLLVKREKKLTSKYNLPQFEKFHSYYLKKGNEYFPVSSKKSVLKVLGKNNAKEIEQHLKKEKIKFNKNKELAMVSMVAYFDQLNK